MVLIGQNFDLLYFTSKVQIYCCFERWDVQRSAKDLPKLRRNVHAYVDASQHFFIALANLIWTDTKGEYKKRKRITHINTLLCCCQFSFFLFDFSVCRSAHNHFSPIQIKQITVTRTGITPPRTTLYCDSSNIVHLRREGLRNVAGR